jgi:polyhydroxyalkanoate synthase
MSTSTSSDDLKGSRAAIDSALDVMLTDAALEPGAVGRFVDPKAVGKTAGGLARHPTRVVRRAGGLGAELARVAVGRSRETPGKRDRRFADPAWTHNWRLHRLLQAYLATATSVDALITDAGLDWRTERRARFTASNVFDAIAPTNFPWSNPVVLKETIDQGGANLARGARRFVRDSPARRGCPRASTLASSRLAATSRSPRERWCFGPMCSS